MVSGEPAGYRLAPSGAALISFGLFLIKAVPEEVGWRGFALPRLKARSSALTASLILGALWGMWHLPLLLTAGETMAAYSKPAWALDIIMLSVLYTWLYNATSGSLLIVTLFHASVNTFGQFVPARALVTAVVAAVVVLVFGTALQPRDARQRPRQRRRATALGRNVGRSTAMVAIATLVSLGSSAPAALAADGEAAPSDYEAVDRFLEAQMRSHGIPGLSLALIEEGRVTHTRGYGQAAPGRQMTAETPMPLGSTTKAFTAVAVLQLAEQGRVDLDAPVVAYLPWFAVADADATSAITVRHLLNHTSGLSDVTYNRVLDGHTTLADGVRDLRHARLAAPVGTKYLYFNGNYSTLALIVETVSGQPFADYVRDQIYQPLGMGHSGAEGDDAPAGVAQGHSKLFGFAVPRDAPPYPYMLGAGHLVSTAPDLARFGIALANDGTSGDAKIMAAASVDFMRTPPPEGTVYGMGWQVGSHRGERVEFHEGAGPTSMSQLVMLPDQLRGYALVMNQEHLIDSIVLLPQLREGLLDLLLGEPAPQGGTSVRLIGAILLAVFVVVAGLAVRSLSRLRGWRQRARAMTPRQLTRAIAPHVIVPVAVVLAVYQLSPMLVGNPFNIGWVGRWYAPDVLLLLAVSTVPDAVQGVVMTVLAITARRSARPRSGGSGAASMRVPPPRHETLLSAGRCPGCSSGPVVGGSRRVLVLALRAPGRSTASTRSCLALPGLGSGPVLWGPMGPVSS